MVAAAVVDPDVGTVVAMVGAVVAADLVVVSDVMVVAAVVVVLGIVGVSVASVLIKSAMRMKTAICS